uniref:Uncharacterized protein n=1 Tax=Maconellicoccus hirsutus TaxID=177089 RepID=A2I482_MACHI|nr:hypothetical protein [Maconellicoccus hirsutus]
MYFKLGFLVIVFQLMCSCSAGETENKTVVSCYYETYCPDSVKFIVEQLFPTYVKLNGTHFIPHMLPYGRANTTVLPNGTVAFQCQHGEKECYGNKVHACVLNIFGITFMSRMKFINCSLAKTDLKNPKQYPTDECATLSGINVQDINNCMRNDTLVNEYLKAYGDETKKYPIPSVPFLIFNGNYDENVSKESVQNFGSVLCKKYIHSDNDTKAAEFCKSQNSSATKITLTVLPIIFLSFVFSKLF